MQHLRGSEELPIVANFALPLKSNFIRMDELTASAPLLTAVIWFSARLSSDIVVNLVNPEGTWVMPVPLKSSLPIWVVADMFEMMVSIFASPILWPLQLMSSAPG